MSNNDAMDKLIEQVKPHLSKFSSGGVVGYCSGAAATKVGKAVAVLAGLAFIAVQSAVYSGHVAVDWSKVNAGGFSVGFMYVTANVPNAGGFSLGFMYGMTYN